MRAMRTLLYFCDRKAVNGSAILLGLALGLVLLPQGAASGSAQEPGAVPAHHRQAPEGPLPATLGPGQFNDPVVKNAYATAARIKKTLYQQPCYCHCDRSVGHGSLLDCYVSQHASGCDICMRETFYAAEQQRKGKSAAQIRAGIIRGDWEKLDITKYQTYPPAK
ncbi:MAG: PCYCGC domain-containing protein [Acidobacteriia bacterium]|nr:PCYCGC domain-containing protein [Terriglobia bacterium]